MALRLRKLIVWTAGIVGVLALAWSAAPYLINMDVFKPAMVDAVRQATGRELVIDGPIELSMYPAPGISARQVHFANAVGTKGAQMLDVRRVVVRPSLLALLRGRIEVATLVLVRPTIVLEADVDGKPNWEFTPGAGAAQPAGAPATGFHLAIGRLVIIRGTLNYTDPRTGKTIVAEQVRARASVGSLDGPFTIAGTATVNGIPLTLDLKVGKHTDKGNDVALSLELASGKLNFAGDLSGVGQGARIVGHLSVATGLLTDFIAALVTATGQDKPAFDSSVVGRFAFDGGVEVSEERLAVTDFKMTMGEETATGSLALSAKPVLLLEGHVSLPKVDLETWLRLLAQSGSLKSPQPALPQPSSAKPTPPALPGVRSPFPPELGVLVKVDVAELLYRKGTIRDLSLAVDVKNGIVALPQLRALLPGDMMLRASTAASGDLAKPLASGDFSLSGPRLRETLAWLEIDASGVPADRLQTLSAHGKFMSAGDKVQVSEATFALDGATATGSGTLALGARIAATVQVQIGRFDLDAYLPEPAAGSSVLSLPTAASGAAPGAANAVPPVDPQAPSFGLKAKVTSLVYRGQPLKGVEVDMSVQGRLLKLNAFKVADLLGAKLDLKGSVSDFGTAPRVDVTFNTTLPDADRVLDYAALPKFLNGRIGAASASGAVVGTLNAVALRNVTVTMLGATARATGSLVLGEKFRFDFPNFDFKSSDASRLVSVATGRNQTGVGALSATGSFRGDVARATFEGELRALNTPLSGRIDTTLASRPNITANLRIPGTLDFDKWLGVAPDTPSGAASNAAPAPGRIPIGAPRAVTAKPIDLSALRAFDASLTLFTSAISVGSVQVTYADLSATLRNGVFRIAKLTGQFYGGAVDFAGTVDASKSTLALDLTGSLQGIYFGEMLRGTAGTNIFGNDSLSVSVDGKISIMNIGLQGRGDTPEAIRNSLTGHGEVSGYLYPAVAKGSLSFASFATGVGSLFSSEMGFSSAVLQGFVNHQSKIAGELQLGGGMLTLRDHSVQGQNAIALITSRTSFTAATTDTTIALDTGTRGPADFVMTVKGPISSPTMTTGRGPGR